MNDRYSLHQHNCLSRGAFRYALVCGLQYERFFQQEMTYQKGVCHPLFRHFPDSQIAWAGPWLIQLERSAPLYEKCNELEKNSPAVSWINSYEDLDTLTEHLSSQLNITLEDGNNALLRFYDPRVLLRLKDILTSKQYNTMLTGIIDWGFYLDGDIHVFNAMEWKSKKV